MAISREMKVNRFCAGTGALVGLYLGVFSESSKGHYDYVNQRHISDTEEFFNKTAVFSMLGGAFGVAAGICINAFINAARRGIDSARRMLDEDTTQRVRFFCKQNDVNRTAFSEPIEIQKLIKDYENYGGQSYVKAIF